MLEVRSIQKSFGGTPVLRDVSLTVAKGDVVAIVGPQRSGKDGRCSAASTFWKPPMAAK